MRECPGISPVKGRLSGGHTPKVRSLVNTAGGFSYPRFKPLASRFSHPVRMADIGREQTFKPHAQHPIVGSTHRRR